MTVYLHDLSIRLKIVLMIMVLANTLAISSVAYITYEHNQVAREARYIICLQLEKLKSSERARVERTIADVATHRSDYQQRFGKDLVDRADRENKQALRTTLAKINCHDIPGV